MSLNDLPYRGYEAENPKSGYEHITPAHTMSALGFLARTQNIPAIINGAEILTPGNHKTKDRYIRGALYLLESQWVLDRDENRVKFNETFLANGGGEQIQIANSSLGFYARILATLENDLGWNKETMQKDRPLTGAELLRMPDEMTVSAALSAFHVLGISQRLLNSEIVTIDSNYRQ